jgi:hypothetical protein
MHKNATKCNKTQSKWCINKHGTSKIIDTFETYHEASDMNVDLDRGYTNEEIKSALFQMGPIKAPGPDGFPALFYQTHWEFFGEDIYRAVRSFLEGVVILEGLCDSIIVLIPKVTNLVHLKKSDLSVFATCSTR